MGHVMLERLDGVPIVISASNRERTPFRPGSLFEFPVILTHTGQNSLEWSQEQPLNLSYRWLTSDGESIELDGLRTALPTAPIAPGARFELGLAGVSPDVEGSYLLQISLVLEGAHWACDIGSQGWSQQEIIVTPAPDWPAELGESRGGRALRGAMAAAELSRAVAKRNDGGKLLSGRPAAVVVSDPDRPVMVEDEPAPVRRGLFHRFSTALGVGKIEQQLGEVIESAKRQEEQTLELAQGIATLRAELLSAGSLRKAGAPAEGIASKKQKRD